MSTALTVLSAGHLNAGVDVTTSAVAPDTGAGNTFVNDGRTAVFVVNASGGPITATFTLRSSVATLGAATQAAITIADTKTKSFGFLDPAIYNDANGLAKVTISSASSVTIVAVSYA